MPSNKPLEVVYTDTLKWPARWVYMGAYMTEIKAQGRNGKTIYTNVPKAHLESQLRIFDMGSCAWVHPHIEQPNETSLHKHPQTTHLNEFTGALSNNSPKGPTWTSLHECPQTTRLNEFTWTPSNDIPKWVYMGAYVTEMKAQGRARKTSCMNMHKAHPRSQLSTFDRGSCAWARPHT